MQAAEATAPARTLSYNRLVGVLLLTVGEKEFGYFLDRIDPGEAGTVAVRLSPFRCQRRDDQPESYDVLSRPDGSGSCECRGFLRHAHCKHADAVAALARRGSI